MNHSIFGGPGSVALQVMTRCDADGEILMPDDRPVFLGCFIKKNAANPGTPIVSRRENSSLNDINADAFSHIVMDNDKRQTTTGLQDLLLVNCDSRRRRKCLILCLI